ncbi:hypothetical protein D770_05120 [Flammeovirgaceae bacterium 311]|nr:hypothetical protein D770_05120 [Flammeovirgaceae bacterium 311]
MRNLPLLLVFVLIGCSYQKQQKEIVEHHQEVNKVDYSDFTEAPDSAEFTSKTVAVTPAVEVKKELIMGAWTDGSTENATLGIDQDSIFYVDAFEIYHYNIIEDSIIIDLKDRISKIKVTKLSEDSMIWESDMGKSTFWKFHD